MFRRSFARSLACVALALAAPTAVVLSTPANALTAANVNDGRWFCTLDGRPTAFDFKRETRSVYTDNGDGTTTVAAGGRVVDTGWFWDRGNWVRLHDIRWTRDGDVWFKHPDGNQWHMSTVGRPGQGLNGYSTWNGKRYPLSCSRSRLG